METRKEPGTVKLIEEIKGIVLNLLQEEPGKLTSHLVEEIKLEYPQVWKELQSQSQENFSSGCSQMWWPSTRITQVLFELEGEGRVKREAGEDYSWSVLE